jgi:ZIP family zinc transporter
MTAVSDAVDLCAAPAGIMLIFSVAVYGLTVPVRIMSALQHLAAGIVLSAVAVELVPIINEAPRDAANNAAIVVGFMGGIALFLVLGAFCEHEHEHEHEDQTGGHGLGSHGSHGSHGHASHGDREADAEVERYRRLENESPPAQARTLQRSTTKLGHARRAQLASCEAAGPLVAPRYPAALAVAVAVDALVDGLLIGISSSSGRNAGVVMAVALAIEMGFLGLTFSTAVKAARPGACAWLLSVAVPPAVLVGGGALGAAAASALADNVAMHTGLISFGVAALLYLVTEELLLEAHSSMPGDDHVWWVDLCFFVGFLMSFLMEKLEA